MSTYRIYIDGLEMDVDDKSARIATTKQSFDFLSVGSSIKANRTNRVSLPLTQKNLTNLKLIHPKAVITEKPYRNLPLRIVNGIEVLPVAVCQIVAVNSRIEIDCQDNSKDFWDALEGKYLNDIDLSAYDGLWDDNRRDTVRNTTSGLVCPVVDTGQFVFNASYLDLYTHGRANVPFFYYKTIMDKVFDLVGYTKNSLGTIFGDTKYLTMAMSTRLVYNQKWIDDRSFKAYNEEFIASYSVGVSESFLVDGWDWVKLNGASWFNTSTGKYTASGAATKFIKTKIHLKYTYSDPGGALTGIAIGKNGSAQSLTTVESGTGWAHVVTTNYVELLNADFIAVYVNTFTDGAPGDVTLSAVELWTEIPNTTDTLLFQNTDWHLYFAQLLPRISLKDFIKDFMMMYGLAFRVYGKTVEFASADYMIETAPTSAELAKEDKSSVTNIEYAMPGIGQKNWFRWVIQEADALPEDYAAGSIDVDNTKLPASVERHLSLFTASDEDTYSTLISDHARFTIYNKSGSAFTRAASFGFRLLLLHDDVNGNVRFKSGTSRTDYKIGRFTWGVGNNLSLEWTDLLNENYKRYGQVLQRYRVIKKKFFLTQGEFYKLDMFVPKSKDAERYLVESASNFIPGQSTELKLIRI